MENIRHHADDHGVVVVLVGNKTDLAERTVSIQEGKKRAMELGIHFTEITAKDALMATKLFGYLAKIVINIKREEKEK